MKSFLPISFEETITLTISRMTSAINQYSIGTWYGVIERKVIWNFGVNVPSNK